MEPTLAQRVSAAAHAALDHANPLAATSLERMVQDVAQRRPRSALDVGCGFGAVAIALAGLAEVDVLGLDNSEPMLARARSALARQALVGTALAGTVRFENRSIASVQDRRFDAVICIGSSQVFGSTRQALLGCAGLLAEGGTVLFADLVWRAEPAPSFVEFLGGEPSDYWAAAAAAEEFARAGLSIETQWSASTADWRRYEEAVHQGRMDFARTLHANEAAEVIGRAEAWAAAYQHWGQEAFGFDAYLARAC